MQSTSTQTFRTVGTQITECDTEELPTEIIGKAEFLISQSESNISESVTS